MNTKHNLPFHNTSFWKLLGKLMLPSNLHLSCASNQLIPSCQFTSALLSIT